MCGIMGGMVPGEGWVSQYSAGQQRRHMEENYRMASNGVTISAALTAPALLRGIKRMKVLRCESCAAPLAASSCEYCGSRHE